MRKSEPTEEQFLNDTATHELQVLRDDGVNRHLRFRRPGTICMGFDILTWPGYLCYTGDMGTYVFRRLEDMFEFFRGSRNGELRPNFGYWAEKVEAADRDGITVYSADIFRARINEWMDENEFSAQAREAVKDFVLPHADDGEYAARKAAYDFSADGHDFTDFQEANLSEYSYRFTWCCYALRWAIVQYDAARSP